MVGGRASFNFFLIIIRIKISEITKNIGFYENNEKKNDQKLIE